MKKANIIIFILIVLIIAAIFGYAIWDANKNLNDVSNGWTQEVANINEIKSYPCACEESSRILIFQP